MTLLQDQHLIPKAFEGHPAVHFNIDVPTNRIYVPTDARLGATMQMTSHNGWKGLHTNYNAHVKTALDRIIAEPNAAIRASELNTLVDVLRVAHARGDVVIQLPPGMTPLQGNAEERGSFP
jgi:hypothetical protein